MKQFRCELFTKDLEEMDYIQVAEWIIACREFIKKDEFNTYEEYKLNCKKQDLEKELKKLTKANEKLKKENKKLKKLNNEILSSTSWKMTKPLRKIRNLK